MTNSELRERWFHKNAASIPDWKIDDEDKQDLIRFLRELELGKVNRGVRISPGSRVKYLTMLKPVLVFLVKPSSQYTVVDIERLELALASGELSQKNGLPYSASTKVGMRKLLRIYLRWKLGKTKAEELAGWLDTRSARKTPAYMKESEIEALYKSCKTAKERYLVAVLFDAGARATEFLNIRYEDVVLPADGEQYARITLKDEYSKTKGRTIGLFWHRSAEAVSDYLHEREAEGIQSSEPVFNSSYNSARFFIQRLGRKVLGRNVHLHLFRHTSATYYANKLNRQEICYRYGWAFSSDMPDVYISRAGMDNKQLEEKFSGTELKEVRSQLSKQRQENRILQESQTRLQSEQSRLNDEVVQLKSSLAAVLDLTSEAKRRIRG